ncbi:MAG: flagellar basal body P-ring formation chaperone FlgA [Pseudomonadales bacterium]|nr:flagellar basal body P-ring formation chaperone FlgA [Pseudomonadales bacterium]
MIRLIPFIQLLCVLCLSGQVFASDKPLLVIELQPVISESQQGWKLEQLAKIYGDRQLRENLSGLSVASIKMADEGRVIEAEQLELVIENALAIANVDHYDIVGPKRIRIAKPSIEQVERSKLRKAAAGYLYRFFQEDYPSLEIEGFDRSSAEMEMFDGLNIQLIRKDKPYQQHCVWLSVEQQRIRECLRLKAWMPVPVALRTLEDSEPLLAADLVLKKMDVAALAQVPVRLDQLTGRYLADKRIAKDQPLFVNAIRPKQAVAKNSTVTLVSRVGAVSIMTTAVAMHDSKIGQRVAVTPLGTDGVVYGTVEKENWVSIAEGVNQ